MKYGMNLFLWTDQLNDNLIPTLEKLKEIGFDGVEVPVMQLEPDLYASWGKTLDRIGLERTACTVRGPDADPISTDPAIRERGICENRLAIDCCAAIGAKTLVGPFHSGLGVFTGQGPTKDDWNRGVESMQRVAEHAQDKEVTLGLEYLNRFECYLLNCAKDTVRFAKEVDSPNCRVMFDTFHANIEEKSFRHAIETSASHLCHVHISENDRGTPGEGNVPWNDVFRSLKKANYNGWLTIEAFGLSLPALAAATKIWRRMYRNEEQVARDGLAFMKYHWEDNPALAR